MALIDIEKDFPFLSKIELNNKNKNQIIKNIKFNEDEIILLKYIKYIDKNFGTYVKQLIESDIYNKLIDTKDVSMVQESSKNNNNLDEEYLIKLIEKVIDKKNEKDNNERAITKNDISPADLATLGIPKR